MCGSVELDPDLDRQLQEVQKTAPLIKLNALDFSFLQQAHIFADLSQRVYQETSLCMTPIQLAPIPDPLSPQQEIPGPTAMLVGSSYEFPFLPVHAVWEVEKLGVVVVFRGTQTKKDALIDAAFTP